VSFGQQSVDLADRSGDAFQRMANRTALADALHQSGRLEESAETFVEAEALQAERQPGYPRLYSFQGYQYCDLLLSRGEPVRERAEQTLYWVTEVFTNMGLLDIALDHLSLGRAHQGLGDFARAAKHLDQAVEGLRRAGREDCLPWGLLARSALRRLRKDWSGAEADLSEALEIAERGQMRLHECDAHLEWARLCADREDPEGAERHRARARKLVEETGYGRRRREVGLA
jgi:tetratricopeptide (TPR) repeat protein